MQTETPPAEAAEHAEAPPPPRRRLPRPDPLLVACALVLVAFPFAATFSADSQPVDVRAEPPAVATERSGRALREVPIFTPGGAAAGAVADGALLNDAGAMRRALDDALEFIPPQPRAAFEGFLAQGGPRAEFREPPYPFHWDDVDAVLDDALPARLDERARQSVNDLAGLLILGAVRHPIAFDLGSAPVAFALLDRARADGDCVPQLNLAFLLSTHERPLDAAARSEYERAARACSNDPTPLWLLGQYLSQRAYVDYSEDEPEFESEVPPVKAGAALTVFRDLQRRFPSVSAGWAGEADAKLRVAYRLDGQPFTARSTYRRALELYQHARSLDPNPALAAGEAHAYAGLRQYGDAAGAQRVARAAADAPGPLAAHLVEYLERAGRFDQAVAAATALEANPGFPDGPALYPQQTLDDIAGEPLSLGSGRSLSVQLDVAPTIPLPPTDTTVDELSFLPGYREVAGVTEYNRFCPEWSRRRDLLLAGRPRQALAGLGGDEEGFRDTRPGLEEELCPSIFPPPVQLLGAVAQMEAGDPDGAVVRLRGSTYEPVRTSLLIEILDARQNLWRFAGDYERARIAVDEWIRAAPASAEAYDRAGEVAFFAEDYARASRLFGIAARRARSAAGNWTAVEAEKLLKRGTALARARRYADALEELRESDDVASRVHALALRSDGDDVGLAAYVSYNARLQSGQILLRLRRYADALDQYEAARERRSDFGEVLPGGVLVRPEVLDNNEALARMRVGDPAGALPALKRALAADPLSPIFLQNHGVALRELGRLDEAASAYRGAVRSDPTSFPAWNDLGVVLARQGELQEAVAAFRHAVGAEPSYPLGWFNLGVALERRGLRHAVAAEGAYGRAFRLDPELRGRDRTFVADDQPYFTTLDLSKPLPPQWEFTSAQERTPVAVAGLALALLFGLQFGRTALAPGLGRDARRWLELGRDAVAKLPAVFVSVSGWAAVGATLLVFLLPLLRSGEATRASVMFLGVGVLALVALVVRLRVLVARREGVQARQRGWTPGMAVGLGAAAFGLGWAPLPVVESERPVPAVHWVGPLATGVAALVLLALGVGLEVPTTRALGTAALVMTASMLTPLEPLDGGHVAKGPAGLAAGLAVLGAAVFFLLGLA